MGSTSIRHELVIDGLKVAVRMFTAQTDYAMINAWYEDIKQSPMPLDLYPPTGLIVEINNRPICAGFIWKTDSKIAVFSMPISTMHAEKSHRNVALNELIESVKLQSKLMGFSTIFAPVNNKAFLNRLEKAGFKIVYNEGWFKWEKHSVEY